MVSNTRLSWRNLNFLEENGQKVTVNADRYYHIIETSLRSNLNQFTRNDEEVWFQQDGVTAHNSRRSLKILR
jgi:hypothetical protein